MSKTKKDLAKLSHRYQVAFALFCAKQTLHITKLKEAHECVRVVELWLGGKATSEECKVAADAAYAAHAAGAAADAASTAAAGAASAAADAAYAAYAAAYAAIDTSYAAYAAEVASAAAHAAAGAAEVASIAAYDCNREAIVKAQNKYYDELLHIDKIFENEVLSENAE